MLIWCTTFFFIISVENIVIFLSGLFNEYKDQKNSIYLRYKLLLLYLLSLLLLIIVKKKS